jgi:hypothetical protein
LINGVHVLVYTQEAEAVRSVFRDVLGFPSVDAGEGWLIFGLPPAELAVHPSRGPGHQELYLMCDDIERTIGDLRQKGLECAPAKDEGWGLVTSIRLPGGDQIGLYEPRHPTALDV